MLGDKALGVPKATGAAQGGGAQRGQALERAADGDPASLIFRPRAEKQNKTHTNASNQKQIVTGKLAVWVSFPSNRHPCLR